MNHVMPCGSSAVGGRPPAPDTEESRRLVVASERWLADQGWLARMYLEHRKERQHAK